MQVWRGPGSGGEPSRGHGDIVGTSRGHLPSHTFALGPFVSGSLRGKGKARASFGRWDDSFPRRNETEQERISRAWEGNQEGQGCPGHGPALWPHSPFPSAARGKHSKARSPPGAWWVLLGGPGAVGGILGEFGLCRVFVSPEEGETEARCQAEGIPGKAPCGNRLHPKGTGSKKQVPDGSWMIPWGSRVSCQCE